jgi:hypothetical protein
LSSRILPPVPPADGGSADRATRQKSATAMIKRPGANVTDLRMTAALFEKPRGSGALTYVGFAPRDGFNSIGQQEIDRPVRECPILRSGQNRASVSDDIRFAIKR